MDILTCEWKNLAFFNYIVSPEIIEKYLPPNTEIDYFNGKCIVSLVAFEFKNVEIGGIQVPFYTDFEEINLRFYVKRFDGRFWRRGTVFISEIVDRHVLSLLANSIFHENYRRMVTKHQKTEKPESLEFKYEWQYEDDWQHIQVSTEKNEIPVEKKSETEFIIHRLWGYGKHGKNTTNEYDISHPLWDVYPVKDYEINVDFSKVYGSAFSHLRHQKPDSVILAKGSAVKAESREKIKK